MKVLKFLADVNIEKKIVDYLIGKGYDTKWIPDYNCELSDEALLNLANTEKRIIITNDKDFGELIFLQQRTASGIILIRVKRQNTEVKAKLIQKLFSNYENKLLKHFTVITNKKFRFIPIERIQ